MKISVVLAGMLLPIDNGPGWLQTLSKFNPLSYVVDAEPAVTSALVPIGAGTLLVTRA